MLRLHWTLALCFWCLLLDHGRADEEAHWGVTPPKGTPTEPKSKPYSYWWIPVPKIPSLPSLPSLPISIPFYSSADKNAPDAVNATDKGPTDPIDRLQEGSGSGEGGIYEASEPPTVSPRSAASATRTDSLPTETSDSPHGSVAPVHNDALVPGSPTSGSVTSAPFTGSATNAQEQNATHTRPPAGHSMGATVQHLPQEHTYTEGFSEKTTVAPETTEAATAFASTRPHPASTRPQPTTVNPGSVEALVSTDPLGLSSPSQYTPTPTSQDSTVSLTTEEAKMVETTPTLTTFSEARTVEDQLRVITATTTTTTITPTTTQGIDHKGVLESITSTTQSPKVNSPLAGDSPGKEEERDEAGASPSSAGPAGESAPDLLTTTAAAGNADAAPGTAARTEDWLFDPADGDATLLPDCNSEHTGVCNLSETWGHTTASDGRPAQNATGANRSADAAPAPSPLMLVPLYTDWNSAMAAWGLAWEAHVYGAGCVFAMVTLASALNLLCLPLRCPSGCGYFALVSLFLLAAGCTRSFSLLYDAYGHQDRLTSNEASLVLYEAPFPCLTAAFGLVFLLLSMRSRMQLSYSAFQRPCFLACLVVLHFAAAFGPVTLLRFYEQEPPFCLFLSLISRGAFVALATFLSTAYFVFYIYVRADSKHIYHLNNTSPTPAERYNRCPFAESRDWDRAALTVCLSALFCLACAGLQLYAMLNALGVAGGEEVFHPWPWWAFQFSCRLCELGVCLTLALVVAQPVYCSDQLPDAGSCWTELLASKSPILPGSYQWTLSQQEKLAIVDTVGLGESESLPLYTLMDERLANSLNGLDLLYHSNRALAYRDLDLDLDLQGSEKPEDGGGGEPSGGSSFTSDSTADLRPPSPINLRRSIDEALFSEALFPMSLFSPARPARCSDITADNHCASPANGFCDPLSADPGLYRTSSCIEMASKPQNPCTKSQKDTVVGAPPSPSLSTTSSCSSPERWRDSSSSCSLYRTSTGGSSLVLCPSPERQRLQQGGSGHVAAPDHQGSSDPQRPYHTLGAASQESLDLDMSSEADRSVQEEFISVCRQIDALSICSETIDL